MKMISAVQMREREREKKKGSKAFRVGRLPEAICQLVNHKSYRPRFYDLHIGTELKQFTTPMGLNRLQACLYHHWRITSH